MDRQSVLNEILKKSFESRLEFMELREEEHSRDLEFCNKKVEHINKLFEQIENVKKEIERIRINRLRSEEKRKEIIQAAANSAKAPNKFKNIADSNKNLREKSLKKNMTVATIHKKADSTKNKTFTQFVVKTEEDLPAQKAPKPGHNKNNLSVNLNSSNKFERNFTSRNISKKDSSSRANTMHNSRDKSTERSKPLSKNNTSREPLNKTNVSEPKSEKKLNNFMTHRNLKIAHSKNNSESLRNNLDLVTNNNTLANKNLGNIVTVTNVLDTVSLLDSSSHRNETSERNDRKEELKPILKKENVENSASKKLEKEFNDVAIDGPESKRERETPNVNKKVVTLLEPNDTPNPLDSSTNNILSSEKTPDGEIKTNLAPAKEVILNKKHSVSLENSRRTLDIDVKKEFPNYHFDLVLKDNWHSLQKFFSKKEYVNMKNLAKQFSILTNESLLLFLQEELRNYEEKLNQLKEKNSEELTKPIPEFSMGRSSSKAIELLDQDKYKNVFKNKVMPLEDILLPYRIYFALLKKTELTSILDDKLFWNECCNYFYVEQLVENIYQIYRLAYNKDKKLASSNYTKLCPTTGIMIFLIRETLEYIGIFIHQKYPPTPSRFAKFYQSVIEGNTKRIEKIKQFMKY